MADPKTSRPFQERFLDGFDRGQLRQAVQKVPPARGRGLRKRYATWALGASLALGSLGLPLKAIYQKASAGGGKERSTATAPLTSGEGIGEQIEQDLSAAGDIAASVAGGVTAAARTVGEVAQSPVKTVAEAPQRLAVASDAVKEQFFKSEIPFGAIIYKEAKKNNIEPELVAAVVKAESRFKPTARSHAGAVGLMQLVPRTGKWMGARDLTNPVQNIQAGTKYLRYLTDRFNGNEEKIIAAYNAGEGNVRRFGGIPPFKETRQYVVKVKNYQKDFGAQIDGRIADLSSGGTGVIQ